MGVLDSVLNQSRIDYIITNVKAKPQGLEKAPIKGQGPLDLNRCEFLEAIVRVAKTKFKDNAPNPNIVTLL